jgi:hypothetical protein
MLAKCANLACNVEFRELSKGRLFLLPPPNFSCQHFKLSDYCYWLCPECDSTHTITRRGPQVVVCRRGPGTTYSAPSTAQRRPAQNRLRSYRRAG